MSGNTCIACGSVAPAGEELCADCREASTTFVVEEIESLDVEDIAELDAMASETDTPGESGDVTPEEPPVSLATEEATGAPEPADTAGQQLVLEVANGPQAGLRIPLPQDEAITIGAAQKNEVCLDQDGCASRSHARIERRGGRVSVTDLNSSNGTFLQVDGTCPLAVGQQVLIGCTLLRLVPEK